MGNLGNYVEAVGNILKGLGEILTPPRDFNAGYNDILKGLGLLGLHQTIIKSLKSQNINPDTLQTITVEKK